MNSDFGLHWFRRDLRVASNPALLKNLKLHKGRVVGLFAFDQIFLDRPDFSHNRFQFFLKTLEALREELRSHGGELLVLNKGPQDVFPWLLKHLKSPPALVSWNRDYEPFALQRDALVARFLTNQKIAVDTERDHLLIEPLELGKDENAKEGYQVYTPFSRKWRQIFATELVQNRLAELKNHRVPKFQIQWKDLVDKSFLKNESLDSFLTANAKRVTVTIPKAGHGIALKKVKEFAKLLHEYKDARDYPAVAGTSHFSIYLKNGSLTIPMVISELGLKNYGKKPVSSRDVFLSELIWREFYYHVLFRHPRVETEAFLKKYQKIKWSTNTKHFQAWCEGKTGFPIVDAGMRQLKETGWMHNRVRMIVASFLTKDLHINWQWGEKYFMNLLLDGDLAPNNGGWQWAASTGTDPQPYFRIFNPWRQSERFDPQGDYIRKYIPELKNLSAEELHAPILGHKSYPEPIIDHSEQSKKAIQMYKMAR